MENTQLIFLIIIIKFYILVFHLLLVFPNASFPSWALEYVNRILNTSF